MAAISALDKDERTGPDPDKFDIDSCRARCEVEPSLREEGVDEAGPVLHSLEPGLHQRGQDLASTPGGKVPMAGRNTQPVKSFGDYDGDRGRL